MEYEMPLPNEDIQAKDGIAALACSPLLQVDHLSVTIRHPRGAIRAVRDVSFSMREGESVALIGESGSGKTMTALTLLGLQPPHAKTGGSMIFRGKRLESTEGAALRPDAGIVFQESQSSLNPVATIGTQLIETLRLRGWSKRAAFDEAVRLLIYVRVPDAALRMKSYPHELSGGMRQRVLITMALLKQPSLLVADEPTTALDSTVQAQVVDLIRSIQRTTRMGLLLITHDLALAAEICSRVLVMYAGTIVEDVAMPRLLAAPAHPYARALIHSLPKLGTPRTRLLDTIDGEAPSPQATFAGCPFFSRCPECRPQCETQSPEERVIDGGHRIFCHYPLSTEGEASCSQPNRRP